LAIKYHAYGKLRDIIERHGGTMTYHRKRFRYGAWIIALDGKTKVIKAMGNRSFEELDQTHIPRIADPKCRDDYRNELIPGAEEKLLALVVRRTT